MMKAKEGSKVKVHYKGTLKSGEVFDSSEGRDPLEFKIGAQQVIKGFEEAVTGMEAGDEKTVTIKAAEAYGDPNPELVQKVPKDKFGDFDVKEGMVMAFRSPDVEQDIPATIKEVGEEKITIDMNPPLAGKDLTFEIKLVEVE